MLDPHPPLPQWVDVPPRLEPLPVVGELPGIVGHRRPERRATLDEHVLRPIVGRVRARMKGDRDVWVAPDAVELLPCPHRAFTVTTPLSRSWMPKFETGASTTPLAGVT